jgi:putative ABC transport system permease protein
MVSGDAPAFVVRPTPPMGARVSVLGTAPWRRAPLLLRRSPAVLLAVLAAGLILGTAAAATPLFLSSAANAALARQIEERCPPTAGFQVATNGALGGAVTAEEARRAGLGTATAWPAGRDLLAARERAVRQVGERIPKLGPPVLTMSGPQLQLTGATPDRSSGGRLLYRDGFEGQIRKLAGASGGSGVWLPSQAAAQLGARPGDRVTLSLTGRTAPARVAGVYRELYRLPPTPYWCSQGELIYPPGFAEDPPAPLVLADRATFTAVSQRLQEPRLEYGWDLELADGITLAQAKQTAAAVTAARHSLAGPGSGMIPPEQAAAYNSPGVTTTASELPFLVERSDAIVGAVGGAIGPVAVAGVGVALLLVAAAGSYWVDRRRVEVALLATKGVGPLAVAVKAVLEMAPWALLGGGLGWLAAVGLVRLLGPSDLLDPSATPAALGRAGVALLAGLALLGLVAGLRTRAMTERGLGARPGWLARVPWELAVLALAAIAYRRLTSQGPPVATGTEPPRIDLLLLAFPMLFLAGTVGLAVRLLALTVPRLRRAGSGWPHALYLAARRVGHGARLALLLAAASALSIGVMLYAATLTLSVRTTLDAKARTFVGSDVAVEGFTRDATMPADLDATVVDRYEEVRVDGYAVMMLAIDPATFTRGAFWDPALADRPLERILADLAPGPAGTPLPVVVVGRTLPDRFAFDLSLGTQARSVRMEARVSERVRAFPGMRANPLVVVDRRALASLDPVKETLLWARGGREQVMAALDRADIRVVGVVTDARDVLDVSSFLATAWTFGFLQALGVLTGLITAGGLLLYLETRQRSRRAAYALSRRMGLSRAAHLGSLLAEVGGTLLGGLAIGVGLSFVAARLVYLRLDALPTVPPVPLLRTPVAALAGTAAAVLAVTWLAAWLAQRSADRTNLAEVLRLAE